MASVSYKIVVEFLNRAGYLSLFSFLPKNESIK